MALIVGYKGVEGIDIDHSSLIHADNVDIKDIPLNEFKMSENLIERALLVEWENLQMHYKNGNSEGFEKSSEIIASYLFDKSHDIIKLIKFLDIPSFIVHEVKNDADPKRLTQILRLAINIITAGDQEVFLFFHQQNFFSCVDSFMNSQNTTLITCAVILISSVLDDYVRIGVKPPFDFSPNKISEVVDFFFIRGPLFCLLGNILCEIPSLDNINEYIQLGFNILKPVDNYNRFFEGIDYVLHLDFPKFWPLIRANLELLYSFVFCKSLTSENMIISNSLNVMTLLNNLIENYKVAKQEIVPNLPFKDLLMIAEIQKPKVLSLSIKLLAKTVKHHIFEAQILFESSVYHNIIDIFENGQVDEKISCMLLVLKLFDALGDDGNLSIFLCNDFFQILVDFIDPSLEKQFFSTLKLINVLINKQPELIQCCDESLIRSLEEMKINTSNEKILSYITSVMKLIHDSQENTF